jgi:hypothetical protein
MKVLTCYHPFYCVSEIYSYLKQTTYTSLSMDTEFLQHIKNENITEAKEYIRGFDKEYNVFQKPQYLTTKELLEQLEDNEFKAEILQRCIDPIIEFKMCKKEYLELRQNMCKMINDIITKKNNIS